MASAEPLNVPFIKKRKTRPTTSRQRSASPSTSTQNAIEPSPSTSKSQVVLPSRKTTSNLLSAGTKRTSSQRQADESDVWGDTDDTTRRDGPGINWGADGSHLDAALKIIEGDEAEALLAKKMKRDNADEDDLEGPDDGMYRGQKAYTKHIKKSQEVPKAMRTGPQRSTNSTIRTVTITDYQPDVCKDYKGATHSLTLGGP